MKHHYKKYILLIAFACLLSSKSMRAAGAANAPVLILGKAGSFDKYTGEILRLEGFNEFEIESIEDAALSLKYLQDFDIIILTETAVTAQQKEMLDAFVKTGGNLIAFRPDKKLSDIFGLDATGDSLREGYLFIDTTAALSKGLLTATLQFHGAADKYNIKGSNQIASLYNSAFQSSGYPAVVMNNYGSGHAAAFTYNLPKSIAYTRQGNYQFAGQEKDGITGLRAMDMFTGGWVDTSKNTINQADEQVRLLSHCIEALSNYKKPLPRFWYFPDTLKCLVTLTNDGEYRSEKDFEPQFADIESKSANMALYILSTEKVSKTATDRWQQRGNEISGHPDDTKNAAHPTWLNMNNAIATKLEEINSRFGIAGMRTVVNHWFVWCGNDEKGQPDFAAQAKLEALHGIEMDINYAHYDNNSNQGHFLGAMGTAQGNYTGSGLPLKFADEKGALINIYQHFNNVYDQQYMEHKDSIGFYNCFKGLMERSLDNEVYSYVCIKAHNDEYSFSKTALLKMLDYSRLQHIPVWTPVKLLDFLKAKDEASFNQIQWCDNKNLSFNIKSSLKHTSALTCMVPYLYNNKKIKSISVDKAVKSYSVKSIKGFEYAFFTVAPGDNYEVLVKYSD